MCKDEKEISYFPIVNRKTGRIIYCIECKRKYDREYWNNVKKLKSNIKNQQQALIRIRNRTYIIELLKKSKCMDCPNNDWRVLEFDHRDTKKKLFNIADSSCISINKIQEEIDKCDIVCANCHCIRTIKQRGYYLNTGN